jgi:hypothetical protein
MDDATIVTAPIPSDETERVALLASCALGEEAAPEFDDLTRLAARVCNAPIAYVSLIERDRQWFKAKVGFTEHEVPRRMSICSYTIGHDAPLVVPDMLEDERFAKNPLYEGPPRIRFYAGVPLRIERGSAIGTLCVADVAPREIDAGQLEALEGIARQIARDLALRSELVRARRASKLASSPAPGDAIGKWTIVRSIGQGGLGAVFEARDASGDRVAIKCLLSHWAACDDMIERFTREARVLASLRSPRIARIVDVGNLDAAHDGAPFIAMEYLEGEDLRERTAREGRASWSDAARWIAEACDGLAEAHGSGIIHRDVKPANLFLERSGAVKVIDFGIAKIPTALDPVTKAGMILGSLRYMSPEQILAADSIDPRGDVWSLGVVLYEILTAARLFRGESELQVASAVLNVPIAPIKSVVDVPPHIEEVLARCLERDRSKRFANAAELAAALRA